MADASCPACRSVSAAPAQAVQKVILSPRTAGTPLSRESVGLLLTYVPARPSLTRTCVYKHGLNDFLSASGWLLRACLACQLLPISQRTSAGPWTNTASWAPGSRLSPNDSGWAEGPLQKPGCPGSRQHPVSPRCGRGHRPARLRERVTQTRNTGASPCGRTCLLVS